MEKDLTQRAQRLQHRGHGEFVLLLDGRIKDNLRPAVCFNSDSEVRGGEQRQPGRKDRRTEEKAGRRFILFGGRVFEKTNWRSRVPSGVGATIDGQVRAGNV